MSQEKKDATLPSVLPFHLEALSYSKEILDGSDHRHSTSISTTLPKPNPTLSILELSSPSPATDILPPFIFFLLYAHQERRST